MSKPVSELTESGDVNVVTVVEEIDIANACSLEGEAEAALAGTPKLIISLERCHYIDSSGLRTLIRLSRRHGIEFAVVVPPGTQARRIFDLAGLSEQMAVFETVQAAIASLRSGPTLRTR